MKSVKERDKSNPYTEVGIMKKQNYEFMLVTYDENMNELNTTWRKTEKGVSNWANKMFFKHGEKITVEVYKCYDGIDGDFFLCNTYHA